jgi:hypothetical protein
VHETTLPGPWVAMGGDAIVSPAGVGLDRGRARSISTTSPARSRASPMIRDARRSARGGCGFEFVTLYLLDGRWPATRRSRPTPRGRERRVPPVEGRHSAATASSWRRPLPLQASRRFWRTVEGALAVILRAWSARRRGPVVTGSSCGLAVGPADARRSRGPGRAVLPWKPALREPLDAPPTPTQLRRSTGRLPGL